MVKISAQGWFLYIAGYNSFSAKQLPICWQMIRIFKIFLFIFLKFKTESKCFNENVYYLSFGFLKLMFQK